MAKTFEFGICVDNAPFDQVDPKFNYFEIPNALLVKPFDSDGLWQENKRNMLSYGRKMPTASHYIQDFGLMACGPKFDRKQQIYWAERSFKRMHELGIEVVGIYGAFFKYPEGYSKAKAIDDAISFCNICADQAEKYNMLIALEPEAELNTLFPRYLEGIEFAKSTGRKSIKVMADLNYFYKLNQPIEDIMKEPEYCLNVHIQGSGGAQPNVGIHEKDFIRLFEVLKEIGYTRGITVACPWVSTKGGELDWKYETGVTIEYLLKLREKVCGE